jgi:hypothetical protein
MITILYLIKEHSYHYGNLEKVQIIFATDKKSLATKKLEKYRQDNSFDYSIEELTGEELDLL